MNRFIGGLVIGLLIGIILGVVVSQNFYEYHALGTDEDIRTLVNQQHWEPAGTGPTGVTVFFRRPRFRLGG
jgi:hypothetical protein